jgi:putative tRNA adenosine deaminase-associated protein
VAYFAALLTRSADRWQARDADLDEVEDLGGLVEFIREAADDDGDEPDTAVLLLEQEDVWFAVVRLDPDEDLRLFVSDAAAVSRSAYADLLLAAGLPSIGEDGRPVDQLAAAAAAAVAVGGPTAVVDDVEDEEEPVDALDALTGLDDEPRHTPPAGPAGDAELLTDFAVRPSRLVGLCGGRMLPAEALAELAEALGAAEELEEVR